MRNGSTIKAQGAYKSWGTSVLVASEASRAAVMSSTIRTPAFIPNTAISVPSECFMDPPKIDCIAQAARNGTVTVRQTTKAVIGRFQRQTSSNASADKDAFVSNCQASCSRAWAGQSGFNKCVSLISRKGTRIMKMMACNAIEVLVINKLRTKIDTVNIDCLIDSVNKVS